MTRDCKSCHGTGFNLNFFPCSQCNPNGFVCRNCGVEQIYNGSSAALLQKCAACFSAKSSLKTSAVKK